MVDSVVLASILGNLLDVGDFIWREGRAATNCIKSFEMSIPFSSKTLLSI
jgi:hypothetical protein